MLSRSLATALFLLCALTSQQNATAKTEPASPPISYGLVIDNTDTPSVNEAIVIGREFFSRSGSADRLFVIRFTNGENITIEQDFTAQKSTLTETLDNMFAEKGPRALLDAIYLSAQHFNNVESPKSGQRVRALVVVTHGADEDSFHKAKEVYALLRKEKIRLFVIGVGADLVAREALNSFVKGADARSFFPATDDETKTTVQEILAEIRR